MPLTLLISSSLLLAGCSRLHPLEEKPTVHVPHVVKEADLSLKPRAPIYDQIPEVSEIPDDPSKYYIY